MSTNPDRPLIGAHMPVAGGLHNGITAGKAIGCETVQVFTSSPRQWKSKPPLDASLEAYKLACRDCGIAPTIAHDSYLINLASGPGDVLTKSLGAFRDELERAEAFGIEFLVSHPGAHLGEGVDVGIKRLIESLDQIHQELPGYKVRTAIETTAGQGTYLGDKFEQIAQILGGVKEPERLAVCIDTCHMLASGYDIRDKEAFETTMSLFDEIVGLRNIAVIHANDSQKGLGSKVDRHAHIGEGEIGIEGFRLLVNYPAFAGVPIIVETPDADTMHEVNVKRLRDLIEA